MASQALILAKEVKYDSAGTVEFVVDSKKNFYFLEMNTRLQVEHPVTELVTGIDLVEQMILSADNKKLAIRQEDIKLNGWSVESRIYAEDPTKDFLPSIGRVTRYIEPKKIEKDYEVIRNDTGISPGSEVSLYYDPMISKLAVHSKDRISAINLMINSLQNYYLSGLENNIDFLIAILEDKKFQKGEISTNFIKEKFKKGYSSNLTMTDDKLQKFGIIAMLMYAKQSYNLSNVISKNFSVKISEDYLSIFLNEAAIVDNSLSLLIEINKKKIKVESSFNLNQKLCSFKVNEEIFYFKINDLINMHTSDVSFLDCRTTTVVVQSSQKDLLKIMPKDVKEDLSKKLISPMPGLIKSVDVIEGQKVKNADQLLIIEAMKMENILKSEKDCVIEKILVKAGDSVSADEELILFKN